MDITVNLERLGYHNTKHGEVDYSFLPPNVPFADTEVKLRIREAIFNKLIQRGSWKEMEEIRKTNPLVSGIIYDGKISQTIPLPNHLQKYKGDIATILKDYEQNLCDSLRQDNEIGAPEFFPTGIERIVLIQPENGESRRDAYSRNIKRQLDAAQPNHETRKQHPLWAFKMFFDKNVILGYSGKEYWFNEVAERDQKKSYAIANIPGTFFDVFHGDGLKTIHSYGHTLRLAESYDDFEDEQFLYQAVLELYKTMRHNWACLINELKLFVHRVQTDPEFRHRRENIEKIDRYVAELGHYI